ncbi:hypothetical protein K458DRAFT_432046 [Lentithecium fluviatile CBS 122367]|uniref:L-dopachrome isomerase n=1 Tax=Lentithecium fluviatile CBS 122367 TaxID=1168545 RepID=A0A6G1J0Y3_9PLEO|nr:hypothetical protein K458DRAFT_432046 [Lentithecium fluviatile CBS 122367]
MPHSAHASTDTMSRPTSTSTYSANAFPRPAGATLLVPETVGEQLSPSRSTFSFDSSPKSVQDAEHAVLHDDVRNTRPASRGVPTGGDAGLKHGGSRGRAQYYEEQFAYKDDATSSARERVTKDAPIVAELRTNVIIKDEYTLVTDLSHHLSTRYQRPESSIMITVNHSACLLLGGSFEPTYVLTITALPIQLLPTTNKRNAALIQNFMFESIGVPLDRGMIKFIPIQEECIATNGMTILGEIERLEQQQVEANGGLARSFTKGSRKSAVTKAKSSFQLTRKSSKANTELRSAVTPPLPSPGPFDSGVSVNKDQESTGLQSIDENLKSKSYANHRLSKSLGEKPVTKGFTMTVPPPPPIPADKPTPKISKRKSLISIFRR